MRVISLILIMMMGCLSSVFLLLGQSSDVAMPMPSAQTIYIGAADITPTLIVPNPYGVDLYQALGDERASLQDAFYFARYNSLAIYVDQHPTIIQQIVSPNEAYEVWHVCMPMGDQPCEEGLVFMEAGGTNVIEILDIPLPHRPLSNVVWVENAIFAFDRWSQPHFGWRYAVDVEKQELILAVPIGDEYFEGFQAPLELATPNN